MSAFATLCRKDFALFVRNRRAVLMSLVAPVLIAAFLGSVMGGVPRRIEKLPVAVVDLDGSETSRAIVDAIAADSSFAVRRLAEPEALELVRRGKLRAAAVLPAGFGAAAARALFRPGAPRPEIVLHYDPAEAMALAAVKGLLTEHVMQTVTGSVFRGDGPASELLGEIRRDVRDSPLLGAAERDDLLTLFDSVERVQQRARDEAPAVQADAAGAAGAAGGAAGGASGTAQARTAAAPVGLSMPYETREVAVTARGGRAYNAFGHSFAGMGVQFMLLLAIDFGLALLIERRAGLWQRLRAAPLSRTTLLGSRVVSGAGITFLLLLAIYAVAIVGFGVRIDGSVAGFLLSCAAFGLMASATGLLIAALGGTPEVTRGLAIVLTLLLVMLGGAWVPNFMFPPWLQAATQFVPTRWAIDALEATSWRGLGLEAIWPQLAAMLAFAAACVALAVRRFRWQE
ncbi:MAG: ABC transporter permease [Steroidobacteraceae bacterium]